MHFTKVLALLSLSPAAYSYMVKVYSERDCGGAMQEINVYDNTCRDTNLNHAGASIEVTAYGAHRQRAAFYSASACNGFEAWTDGWADGGSDWFLKGRCINLWADGRTKANAYGSRSA